MSCFLVPISRRQWPAADDAGNGTGLYLDQTAGVHVYGRRPMRELHVLVACIHPSIHPPVPPSISASVAPPLLSTTPVRQRSCSHACRYRCWMQSQSRPGRADLHLRPSPPAFSKVYYVVYIEYCGMLPASSPAWPPDSTDGGHVALVVCGPSHLPDPRCSPWAACPAGLLACPLPPSAGASASASASALTG